MADEQKNDNSDSHNHDFAELSERLAKIENKKKENKSKFKTFLNNKYIYAIIVLVIGLIFTPLKKCIERDEKNFDPNNSLKSLLIVNEIKNDSIWHNFRIRNTSNASIQLNSILIFSPGQSVLYSLNPESQLGVNEEYDVYPMSSVIGIGNDFLKDEILYFKTQLNVEFQFTENPNKNDTFNRIFEFEIPLNFLKKSEFNPSKSYIDSISILEQKQLWEAQRQLGQKAGSIFLVLSAPRLDSDYIIPIIGSINTNLFYGTNQNNFILLRRLSNGKSIRIELPTKEKEKRMYLVTLIWSDSLTELGVDNRDSVIYHATWQSRTILRL